MKGVLLLSGGIDSPVAGSLVKKRLDITAVHFSSEMFVGTETVKKCKKLAKKLDIPLKVVDISEELLRLSKEARHDLYFVLMKRLMLRSAERLAESIGAGTLITGENLGQVSSQTLANLSTIDKAVRLPTLRPLLTMEKNEIVRLAEKIGTFEISKGPENCDALGPAHPRTRASVEEVESEEQKVGADKMVEKIAARLLKKVAIKKRTA